MHDQINDLLGEAGPVSTSTNFEATLDTTGNGNASANNFTITVITAGNGAEARDEELANTNNKLLDNLQDKLGKSWPVGLLTRLETTNNFSNKPGDVQQTAGMDHFVTGSNAGSLGEQHELVADLADIAGVDSSVVKEGDDSVQQRGEIEAAVAKHCDDLCNEIRDVETGMGDATEDTQYEFGNATNTRKTMEKETVELASEPEDNREDGIEEALNVDTGASFSAELEENPESNAEGTLSRGECNVELLGQCIGINFTMSMGFHGTPDGGSEHMELGDTLRRLSGRSRSRSISGEDGGLAEGLVTAFLYKMVSLDLAHNTY